MGTEGMKHTKRNRWEKGRESNEGKVLKQINDWFINENPFKYMWTDVHV